MIVKNRQSQLPAITAITASAITFFLAISNSIRTVALSSQTNRQTLLWEECGVWDRDIPSRTSLFLCSGAPPSDRENGNLAQIRLKDLRSVIRTYCHRREEKCCNHNHGWIQLPTTVSSDRIRKQECTYHVKKQWRKQQWRWTLKRTKFLPRNSPNIAQKEESCVPTHCHRSWKLCSDPSSWCRWTN